MPLASLPCERYANSRCQAQTGWGLLGWGFEQFDGGPSSERLPTYRLSMADANSSTNKDSSTFDEDKVCDNVIEAAAICDAEKLKVWGAATIRGLQAVLTVVWQFGTIPSDLCGITILIVSGKVFSHLLLMQICRQLLELQRHEEFGFM